MPLSQLHRAKLWHVSHGLANPVLRSEGLDSMSDATKYLQVHTGYVLVKSVSPKVLWAESQEQVNFAELTRTVTCTAQKANANDNVLPAPCHDEFRGPRSDYVRQVALATA
ncbi:hypothetical protein TNCV_4422631 [Trichonephila clavipes]|nr:hypothetical protein TNCV_4422631 [Trichonephila clavipes]